jgi:hypothetical protein
MEVLQMTTRLIQLGDDTLVEVEASSEDVQQISYNLADRINDVTLAKIKPILVRICEPIADAWTELSQDMNIEQAEIELGLSFEGEGNIYVTKTKAGANLAVKLILKPPSHTNS